MGVASVVRQWPLMLAVIGFLPALAFGIVLLTAAAAGAASVSPGISVFFGPILVLVSLAMIVVSLLSLTIRSKVGPDGVSSAEVGARWSFAWGEIAYVWMVSRRGQMFLAVLPAPTAPSSGSRAGWRNRKLRLPAEAVTVRIKPDAADAMARVIEAERGQPAEPYAV